LTKKLGILSSNLCEKNNGFSIEKEENIKKFYHSKTKISPNFKAKETSVFLNPLL